VRTTTVVIGAGHAGLAMSRRLTERSIDHVVLERGEVANAWKTERWPWLRLLTPNRQTRLPGLGYDGPDPDGFMTMPELIGFVERYARSVEAPVRPGTTVLSVRPGPAGYEVVTTGGTWHCATVVIASGACNTAVVPPVAEGLPPAVASLTPLSYRGAGELADGGVLVVGASATGVQLAAEVRRTGRPVWLAVGEHVRLPRRYRGRDILWWMDAAGVLDQRHDEVDDIVRARHVPSPQLVGTPERATLDLNTLAGAGVRLVGRLGGITGGAAQFSGSLPNLCTLADLKLNRLLDGLDRWAGAAGLDGELPAPERFEPTAAGRPPLSLDLRSGEVRTVVWACGYRPDHSWLHLPVFDRRGRLNHDGGVVADAPGVYLLGAPFLRRRRSSFISGAEFDTAELGHHLHRFLDERARRGQAPPGGRSASTDRATAKARLAAGTPA